MWTSLSDSATVETERGFCEIHYCIVLYDDQQTSSWSITLMEVAVGYHGYGMRQAN